MSFHYVRDTVRPTPCPSGSDPMNLKAKMLEGEALWADTNAQGQPVGPLNEDESPRFTLLAVPSNPSTWG